MAKTVTQNGVSSTRPAIADEDTGRNKRARVRNGKEQLGLITGTNSRYGREE